MRERMAHLFWRYARRTFTAVRLAPRGDLFGAMWFSSIPVPRPRSRVSGRADAAALTRWPGRSRWSNAPRTSWARLEKRKAFDLRHWRQGWGQRLAHYDERFCR